MGPRSRELLARLTDDDMTNAGFPFGSSREISLGHATVRASRISYVGELGWELYVPTDMAATVYDALSDAGEEFGLRDAGYLALESLRAEKGYRAWGHDLSPDDTPLEAGLGFAVKFDKGDFIGREALLRQRSQGVSRRLAVLLLDDGEALPFHDEPVYCEGELIGRISSAAFGHTLGRAVAFAWLEREQGAGARYEIDIAGRRWPASACRRAPYDPDGMKLKA